MNNSTAGIIFHRQFWHLLALMILLAAAYIYISNIEKASSGNFWGIGTETWYWIAISIAVCHQTYIWLIWRLELHLRLFTSRLGGMTAFKIYASGFLLFISLRFTSLIILAMSNRDSMAIDKLYFYIIAGLFLVIGFYVFYSLIRYFTIRRAIGIDHFIKEYDKPLVRDGIFRYSSNGMYAYGLLLFYVPGLILLSHAAFAAALFYHIYIWVHYYCTEKPDMTTIYSQD